MTNEQVEDEDFLIQISPKLDGEYHWTGQVEINIMSSHESCLDAPEREALLFFCQMICASVPIYEEHVTIREMAAWLVQEKYAHAGKEKLNGEHVMAKVIDTEDNIIRIDFKSKKEH